MSTNTNLVYQVRSDLVSVVPNYLGYRPSDSIVITGSRDRSLRTVVAHDLDTDVTPTAAAMRRHDITDAILIGYGDHAEPFLTAFTRAFRYLLAAGIAVIDVLIVSPDERWLAVYNDTLADHPVPGPGHLNAALAAKGYTVEPGSAIVPRARRLDPASDTARHYVSAALDTMTATKLDTVTRGRATQIIDTAASNGYPVIEDIALMVLAAAHPGVARHALEHIRTAPAPRAHLDLWSWVTKHAAGPDIAAPAVSAAAAAHLCGADRAAIQFTRTAMSASIGHLPALLTNRILRSR